MEMKIQLFLTIIFSITFIKSSNVEFLLAIHAGAIDDPRSAMSKEEEKEFKEGLLKALRIGYKILKNNGTHLDAVQAALNSMEDNPTFNSGKGAKVNQKFQCELDSSIMDGSNLKCGAVASVQRIKNPINAARLVMERTRHVLLVGPSADEYAESEGLTMVPNSYFMTPKMIKEWYDAQHKSYNEIPQHETCGALALDKKKNLAAGTSTGGITYKMAGRVGDSPIIGAGTYANNDCCAISCTGLGENMIRRSVAFDLRARMKYKGLSLKEGSKEVMSELEDLTGGFISIDKDGNVEMPFNSAGMARAWVNNEGIAHIQLFKDGEDYTPIEYPIDE
jgi:beta-aspartyl-peptidase (threonine type)